MVWNIFMMHLCIVATLCFFKIISPRNYYYCDQDDFPWVYGSKYVSKSNCCQRLFVFYILDVKSFRTYRNINISNRFLGYISKVLVWWLTIFGVIPMVFPLLANHLWYWCLVLVSRLFIWGAASGIGALSWDRPTHLCSPYQPNNLYNLVPQTHMYT